MIQKAMVLVAGLTMLSVPQAMAQDESPDHEQMRHRAPRAEMLHKAPPRDIRFDRSIGRLMDRQHELNLTDDQMDALDELRADARSALAPMQEEMRAIHEEMSDESLDREAAGDRMKGIHEQTKASLKELHDRLGATLDDDQMQMMRHGTARHGATRRGAHGSARQGRMRRRTRHPASARS